MFKSIKHKADILLSGPTVFKVFEQGSQILPEVRRALFNEIDQVFKNYIFIGIAFGFIEWVVFI